ncbi:MAG TPA: PTS glucose transporter subunit IIA [Armatimonadota bacterium]
MSEIITAPLSGKIVPLEAVPDPVFAEKMLGDGVAILPDEGILVSPLDGEVIALPSSGHACGIKSKTGVELLVHVGIDTVEMKGQGFRALAQRGDTIKPGQTLIEFDLDEIESAGKSALSPVVVNGATVRLLASGSVSRGEPLMEITTEN